MEWQNDTELFALMRQQLFSAILGDVLDLNGRPLQFLPPQCRPLANHMVVAGRAMPVLEADVFELSKREPFGKMLTALDDLKHNEVYVAAGSVPRYALWGELMATAAQTRGANGAVLAGYSRDTAGIWKLISQLFHTVPTPRISEAEALSLISGCRSKLRGCVSNRVTLSLGIATAWS